MPTGNVFFSDIQGNRILKMDAAGVVTTFRADSGRTNGNTFDAQGRLISCEGTENGPGGRRRIVRTDMKTGKVEVLTERYEGKRYNSPNDVVVDPAGRIWFTDPLYAPDRSIMEHEHEAVYRIDTGRQGHAGHHAAGDRPAQRHRGHAGRQDAVRRRQQLHPARRQPQDLGVRHCCRRLGRQAAAGL